MQDKVSIKTCTRCKQERDVSEFPKNSEKKDGLSYYCRICLKEKSRRYRANNREKISQRRREEYRRAVTAKPFASTPETRLYAVWAAMRQRCNNPKCRIYSRYGGRGIRVCARWDSYHAFKSDMGFSPEGFSLDRIDNNGNYEPSNCRWADKKTQSSNRRVTRMLTHNGVTQTIEKWAGEVGLEYNTLRARINNGWPTEQALAVSSRRAK